MKTTLKDNVNNEFYKQRNALTGRTSEITALVEDYTDTYFWMVLLQASHPGRSFRVIPYQEGDNLTQSKPLIAKEIQSKGGSLYIGCIGSDLNYLLRHYGNELGMAIEQSDYLFHTYAYSMENLVCMPSTLVQVVVSMTSLQASFDFDVFFKNFSNTLFPLFMLDLFLRSKHSKTVVGVEKWKHILPSEKTIRRSIAANSLADIIVDLTKKAKTFERKLEAAPEYDVNELTVFEHNLLASNNYLNNDNCCLFIYGHELIQFVDILVSSVANAAVGCERSRILALTSIKAEVKAEKLQHIDKLQQNFDDVIGKNMGFVLQNGPICQRIKSDLSIL